MSSALSWDLSWQNLEQLLLIHLLLVAMICVYGTGVVLDMGPLVVDNIDSPETTHESMPVK